MRAVHLPRILQSLITICLLGLCALPNIAHASHSESPSITLAQLDAMRQALPSKTLRVARIIAPEHAHEIGADQTLRAITEDYLRLIGDFLDLTIEEVPCPSVAAAIDKLNAGDIDLLTRVTDFERQHAKLTLSHPYLANAPIIVGRNDDNSLPPDLQGKRVLLLADYMDLSTVRHVYPGARINAVPSAAEGLRRLADGEADAFIGDKVRANFHMLALPEMQLQNKFAAHLNSEGFSFAARDSAHDLITLINVALESIPEARNREIVEQRTQSTRLFAPTDAFALTPKEREWLHRHPTLSLIASEQQSYFYRNAQGQWSGLGMDILRGLADAYQLQLEVLDSQSPVADQQLLQSGRAQFATSLPATAERRQSLLFSEPFGALAWTFVIRRDASSPSSLEAMAGRRLALPLKHPLDNWLKTRYPQIEVVRTQTTEQTLELVESGKVDATLNTALSTRGRQPWMIGRDLRPGQVIQAMSLPQVFAISPSAPELRGILDKLLGSVAGEFNGKVKLLTNHQNDKAPWEQLPEGFWHAVVLALVVILLSLLWNWRLKVQVRQRRAAQHQLSDQLAFQFSLLNGLPTPLYVRDLELRLSTCNRAYESFFGSSLEQLQGTTPQEQGMAPHNLALNLEDQYRALLENRQPQFFDGCLESNGERRHIYHWLVPFYNARGRLQGLLGGWIDISERKGLELKLREAQQAAINASAAKSNFLATMSHELRTPLNALVGLLELESQDERAPSENLRIAQQSANSMIDLIGNILDLDKIESGQMQLAPQPVALTALLQDCLDLFAAQAGQKTLALSLDDTGLTPQRQHLLDPMRLRQVLQNLLGNALKFTARGQVRLSVEELDLGGNKSLLTLLVSDTGIGIPQAIQSRIFEPYMQAHAEVAHLYGGSGLGLNICSQLVQLMGGRIWLDSQPGQGCRVSVELPLTWQTAPDTKPQRAVVPALSQPLKVLIVDDVSTNGLVLQQQLSNLGHHATFVCSGLAALDAWEREPFDMLISDCNMPGMDGYTLAQAIRQREQALGLAPRPIIGCTASALTVESQRCRDAGMNDLMIKPVTLARLREALAGQVPQPFETDDPPSLHCATEGFDLSHLEDLAAADPSLISRLLVELHRNLTEECQRLQQPLANSSDEAIEQFMHRLEGLACNIDALGLLRACQGVRQAIGESVSVTVAQVHLLSVLNGLLDDIKRRSPGR